MPRCGGVATRRHTALCVLEVLKPMAVNRDLKTRLEPAVVGFEVFFRLLIVEVNKFQHCKDISKIRQLYLSRRLHFPHKI